MNIKFTNIEPREEKGLYTVFLEIPSEDLATLLALATIAVRTEVKKVKMYGIEDVMKITPYIRAVRELDFAAKRLHELIKKSEPQNKRQVH